MHCIEVHGKTAALLQEAGSLLHSIRKVCT